VCPNCGEESPANANWCEACGQDLNVEPPPICVACGEREVGPEGYCLSCGHKQPEERDHLNFVAGPAVAATDRGRRHRHNEDSVAIAALDGGGAVLVVCDGVSSTAGSAEASLRAADAARDLLVAGFGQPDTDETGSVIDRDEAEALLVRAVAAAQEVAVAAADEPQSDGTDVRPPGVTDGPPSSTLVAAVIRPADHAGRRLQVSVAWVGDSRAYWLGDQPARLTPTDHEIAGSLIRWLGADSLDPTPEIAHHELDGPGFVVVCSDGLWRYAAEPGELDATVRRYLDQGERGVGLAEALIGFANDGGGHDNISVALWSDTPDWMDGMESES
jgi:serine/threonine protein phosphatase PrpC